MDDVYAFMIAAAALIFLTVFVVNFITEGFFFKLLLAKMSRGKKILVEVLGSTRSYFVLGVPSEGQLTYKDASSEKKRVTIKPRNISRRFTVPSVYIDEETNAIVDFRDNFKGVQSMDTTNADRIIARVIAAKQMDNMRMLLLIGLLVAGLGGLAAAFFAYSANESIDLLVQTVRDQCTYRGDVI